MFPNIVLNFEVKRYMDRSQICEKITTYFPEIVSCIFCPETNIRTSLSVKVQNTLKKKLILVYSI